MYQRKNFRDSAGGLIAVQAARYLPGSILVRSCGASGFANGTGHLEFVHIKSGAVADSGGGAATKHR